MLYFCNLDRPILQIKCTFISLANFLYSERYKNGYRSDRLLHNVHWIFKLKNGPSVKVTESVVLSCIMITFYNISNVAVLQESTRADHHMVVLADFALAMTTTLETVNKNSFNQFQLRIGKPDPSLNSYNNVTQFALVPSSHLADFYRWKVLVGKNRTIRSGWGWKSALNWHSSSSCLLWRFFIVFCRLQFSMRAARIRCKLQSAANYYENSCCCLIFFSFWIMFPEVSSSVDMAGARNTTRSVCEGVNNYSSVSQAKKQKSAGKCRTRSLCGRH